MSYETDETVQLETPDGAPPKPSRKDGWPVGTVLPGGYRVMGILGGPGESGMGVVYILENALGDLIAAKTFQHHVAHNFGLLKRFLREAKTWLLLGSHPYIVRAIALEIIEAMPILLMDYVSPGPSGGSLASRLAKGPVPPDVAVRLFVQCCDALIHAAAAVPGFVHRDLKPDNLLLDQYDNIQMTDFGLVSCLIDEEWVDDPAPQPTPPTLTQVGSVMGTPAYMAPEQFTDPNRVTARADIYALGCVFYEALSGKKVFNADGLSGAQQFIAYREHHLNSAPTALKDRVVNVPEELCAVVMRCLEKQPMDRYRSVSELRLAIYEACHSWCTVSEEPMPETLHMADGVAQQIQAMGLLEGYERAVQHRSLREHFTESPYAFHLALASFFRVEKNPHEEKRQLENALGARGAHRGYEAVRRLAERYLADDQIASASAVISEFITENLDSVDLVIEPYVEILIKRGELGTAINVLESHQSRRHGKRLLSRVYKHAGREEKRRDTLLALFNQALDGLKKSAEQLEPQHNLGVDRKEDVDVYCEVLREYAPESYCERLHSAQVAPWPRLDVDFDIASDLAYLSWAAGELALCVNTLSPEDSSLYTMLSMELDYPDRYENFINRDEDWIWKVGK